MDMKYKGNATVSRPARVFLIIGFVMALIVLSLLGYDLSFAGGEDSPSDSAMADGPMDFESCITRALKKSPYFSQSAIEIEIRRLGESDSKWSYVPSLTLRTNTYMGLDTGNGTKLKLGVDGYDPVSPYFSVKASKLMTEIAVVMHLKYISKGLYDIAVKIIELEKIDRVARRQDKILACLRENKAFFEKRQQAGMAAQIEGRLADQQLDVAEAEMEALKVARDSIIEGLCPVLDIDSPCSLDIDLKGSRSQILGGFDPKTLTVEKARDNSHELKVQELKEHLQKYRIYLAYAKFSPTISLGMEEPSPVYTRQNTKQNEDYYANMGVSLNLWHGFKDVNDLSRQKMILRRFKNETRFKKTEFDAAWEAAQRDLVRTETALRLSRAREKLAHTETRKMKILYDSNEQPFSKLLDSRIAWLRAGKETVAKASDHDNSLLKLRYLSGNLFNSYVSVEDMEAYGDE